MKSFILIFTIVASCFLCADIRAASLSGKVIEVNSGDVITVFNLNRPVRVKLLGVDAPEMDQAFGDVARKHLSDLVYDKSVSVEYSGISADHSVAGRVLLNSTDVAAQMIRDGVAWVDPSSVSRLSATDREVYQQSEQAARNERRGLWQADNPVAPWDFVRAKSFKQNPATSLNSTSPTAVAKVDRPASELTNLTLMNTGITAQRPTSSSVDSSDMAWASAGPTRGNWHQLRPDGESFSALVPEDGKITSVPLPAGDQVVEGKVYLGRDGWSVYTLMWVTGPTYGEKDRDVLAYTMSRFLQGVGEGYESRAQTVGRAAPFSCELQNQRDISMGGYTGAEFDLRSCTVPGRARIFSKVVNGQRRMYLAAVFYMEEDENVSRFLKSFTVGTPQKTKTR
jgi:micrococcal nuclease